VGQMAKYMTNPGLMSWARNNKIFKPLEWKQA
jgi:hypothetical protein